MAKFKPLAGWVPRPDLAAAVISPPYDVVGRDEARAVCVGNQHCFLRVTRAEVELPPELAADDQRVYERAAANWRKMKARGWLVPDSHERFYVYQLTWRGRSQTGLVGLASVAEYRAGVVRRHELTRPDKEEDRTRHILATRAQTGPVFLAGRDDDGRLAAMLAGATMSSQAEIDVMASDGVRHQLWPLPPVQNREWQAIVEQMPRLYIADGHHRSAAAARAGEELGSEAAQWFLAVLFPADQLEILPYNRLIRDLAGCSPAEFLAGLAAAGVEVTAGDGWQPPAGADQAMLYLDRRWYRLIVPVKGDGVLARLPANRLQQAVLAPLLGINDPRTDRRIDFVGGIRGADELLRRVDSGEWAAAFALPATTMADLLAVADAGEIMPPKSTWFEPKLADGLVVHEIGEW
ncbi:MAG: DUF1015 family protein [Negativicutes bacterium]|nr:DUF1015 family protein [Negativicutes bacterium]